MQKPSNNKKLSPQKPRFRGGVYIESKDPAPQGSFSVVRNVPYVDMPFLTTEGEVTPCVSDGDRVLAGQTVAKDEDTGIRLTASVSGTVRSCDALWDGANPVPAIRIENDFQWESIDCGPLEDHTAENILARLELCNVRCGSRPLWKMIERGSGASILAVTGLDAAPFKSSVRCAAVEYADDVVRGIELLQKLLPDVKVRMVLDRADGEAVEMYNEKLAGHENRAVYPIEALYPHDSRRVLAAFFSGKKLGSVTAERGCVVIDAYTAAAAAKAVYEGEPDTQRIISVSGDAIEAPANVLAPIGAEFATLVVTCGGYSEQPCRIIAGDPLTGIALYTDSVPVTADTRAFAAFKQCADAAKKRCINCGRCADVCPAGLLPMYLYKFAVSEQDKSCRELRIDECIGCAACDYMCPANLPLSRAFAVIKSDRRGDVNG